MDSGFSNSEDTTKLPRHRWYYYKEGFSPNLVEKAIEHADIGIDDLILDPFNGSGTTTLTASYLGYNSIGIEVNPFTSFLSIAKSKKTTLTRLNLGEEKILKSFNGRSISPLIGFSTFSEKEGLDKWLFNSTVLNAFENAWLASLKINDPDTTMLLRLALISSAMQNCNGKRDGKCFRYRSSWKTYNFDKDSFFVAFKKNIQIIREDLSTKELLINPSIVNKDARLYLQSQNFKKKFKLCVTSPPYLNTFDYTDIYRPELFLGKFIMNSQDLYSLRLKTVRSHLQAKWERPLSNDFGLLYSQTISLLLNNTDQLMDKNIPLMVQAYFEDMFNILLLLKKNAEKHAQIWLIVSNSAYANTEIPVDLIIGDIGHKAGWFLKEIGVLRNIKRRKTKHSPDINFLRESVIIFSNSKF
ncbi:hypothetical protein GCM10027275_53640 [Rhabdobacter roseus]